MDKKNTGKEVSMDATRESLIAISNLSPDNGHGSGCKPGDLTRQTYVKTENAREDDNYRSKLISISSLQSPGFQVQPGSPADINVKLT